ncbi:ATP-binding cassette domain-containing protein [Kribbella sp. NPDC050124]|uniref:ATP-binding cassette domain-containing protein n=1 Tax=Kribbella sp. NPDC050124 TaxID=3364114 RepID=UPI0037AEDA3D
MVSAYQAQIWTQYVAFGLVALSFAFVWGKGGIFSFGQSAMFGIGAYSYGVVAVNLLPRTGETLTAVLVAAVVSAVFAAVLGYFMFYGDLGEMYVATITLATSLVLLTVMAGTSSSKYHIGDALLGGYNGMVGLPPITIASVIPSVPAMSVIFISAAVLLVVALRALLRAPFGRVLTATKNNETRTMLLGFDIRLCKLIAFSIGGAVAGLGGVVYATWGLFVNPVIFGLSQAALIAIWVLVGGRSSLVGAFLGVILIQQLSDRLGGEGGTATPFVLGGVLIVVVLMLPAGVLPTIVSFVTSKIPVLRRPPVALPLPEASEDTLFAAHEAHAPATTYVLTATGLAKHFGGVRALQGVDMTFSSPGVHCLLGSNGAGKSTLFNLLVGRYSPSEGQIAFAGHDITRWRADRRARHGLGIKLQVASIYDELSLFENIWLAAYGKSRNVGRANARAATVLRWLDLAGRTSQTAGSLSHGEKQWLEIGMVVASDPAVVLLDEPTAGMTRDETARTAELVRALGRQVLVIVVEHDMDFIRMLDAPVTMFHQGSILTTGSMDELQADERVLDIYLGRSQSVGTQ